MPAITASLHSGATTVRPPVCAPGVFYDAIELLPYEGEHQRSLLEYTTGLDALEIR